MTRIPGGDIQVDDTEGARANFSSEELSGHCVWMLFAAFVKTPESK